MKYLILILAVFGIYAQALDNPLVFDSVLAMPQYIRDAPGLRTLFPAVVGLNRNLTMLTFKLLDMGYPIQIAFNVILHLANAMLCYLVLKTFYSKRTAYFVALFFAVNPAAIYAVCYLVQRSQLLMLFFAFLMVISYLKALGSKLSLFYFVISLVCYKLAISSKESGVALLAIYPALGLARRDSWRCWVYPLFIVAVGASFFQYIIDKNIIRVGEETYRDNFLKACGISQDLNLRSVLTQCGLFFKYLLYWFVPLPTSIDMRVPFVEKHQVQGAILFLTYVVGSLVMLLRKSTRYLGLGLVLCAALFVPEFARVRLGEIFVMYRSYIYSLGYVMALGWVVDRISDRWNAALGLVLVAFATTTFFRAQMFDSETRVWVVAADQVDVVTSGIACQGARAFSNAGGQLIKEGKAEDAISYLKTAAALNPYWDSPLSNLAIAYYISGKLVHAETIFSLLVNSEDQDIRNQSRFFLNQIRGTSEF